MVHPKANLDVLLGIELDVTAEIGSRQMLVSEVLELGAGSVVELRTRIDEPVELKANGRVIARGEIVAVDGAFGLRITELVDN